VLREPRALPARPAPRGPKADPETAKAKPYLRRKHMKPSAQDQTEGKLHELKGKVKEKLGQVTSNPDLATEGQDENLAGKIQKKVGQIEKVFEK
jgi:uncharacterized protein YjbJ (UPF0337 family)